MNAGDGKEFFSLATVSNPRRLSGIHDREQGLIRLRPAQLRFAI
jgi:hypothetical protein